VEQIMTISWIYQYQLFLFDFDGLLVNTEHLHFNAYKKMCAAHGCDLKWDFFTFCNAAHYSSTGIRDAIYRDFPNLLEIEPDWNVLYEEKKRIYLEELQQSDLELMPGVERLLLELEKANRKRCVVTHSPAEQIAIIRFRLKTLDTIPWWITREEYSSSKPNPECYLKAIERYGAPNDLIIGFEDSVRGLRALQGTNAIPILICDKNHPQLETEYIAGVRHFESFTDIPDTALI
jgi:HAD superfamily hydrolase (TIGR01509 family)